MKSLLVAASPKTPTTASKETDCNGGGIAPNNAFLPLERAAVTNLSLNGFSIFIQSIATRNTRGDITNIATTISFYQNPAVAGGNFTFLFTMPLRDFNSLIEVRDRFDSATWAGIINPATYEPSNW